MGELIDWLIEWMLVCLVDYFLSIWCWFVAHLIILYRFEDGEIMIICISTDLLSMLYTPLGLVGCGPLYNTLPPMLNCVCPCGSYRVGSPDSGNLCGPPHLPFIPSDVGGCVGFNTYIKHPINMNLMCIYDYNQIVHPIFLVITSVQLITHQSHIYPWKKYVWKPLCV